MPIHHLLYRCPLCNSETSKSESDRTSCAGCAAIFSRSTKSQIFVQPKDSAPYLMSASALMSRIEESPTEEDGPMEVELETLRSEVIYGVVSGYLPIHCGGELLGYTEVVDEQNSGVLVLGETLDFVDPNTNGTLHSWDFGQLSALVISSTAIQINIRNEGLYQFKLIEDSPKCWEDSLRKAVSQFYLTQGLEVFTYQPVIKTRRMAI